MKYLPIFGLLNVFNWKKSDCFRNHPFSKAHTALQSSQKYCESLKSSFSFQQIDLWQLYSVSLARQFLRKQPFPSQEEEQRKNRLYFPFCCIQQKAPTQMLGLTGIKRTDQNLSDCSRGILRCWNYQSKNVIGEKDRTDFTVFVFVNLLLADSKCELLKWVKSNENVCKSISKHIRKSFQGPAVTINCQRKLKHQ